MKILKIFFVISLFLLPFPFTYAQSPDSFFPHQLCDMWEYRHVWAPTIHHTEFITGDSIAPSGDVYIQINHASEFTYHIDTTFNVYKVLNGEDFYHLYKLDAGTGHSWIYWYEAEDYYIGAKVVSIYQDVFWGVSSTVKEIKYWLFFGEDSLWLETRFLASGFGLVEYWVEPIGPYYYLYGSVIDGIQYGIIVKPSIISVSPMAIADTVEAYDSLDMIIQIENSDFLCGVPLNWSAWINYKTTDASVDFIGNDVALNTDVLAVGTPAPLDKNDSMKSNLTIDAGEMAEIPMSFQINNSGSQPIEIVLGEEVFGNTQYIFGPHSQRGRGNMFVCGTSRTLIEHRLYLNITVATSMQFLVYEGATADGFYNVISVSNIDSAGPGEGWYSSGNINVPIRAGKFYMIFAQWQKPVYYYNQQNIFPYPIPTSFGNLIAGMGWAAEPTYAVPPPAKQSGFGYTGYPVAFYQTIVTGEPILSFIKLFGSTSGSIGLGEMAFLNIELYGLEVPDTLYTAEIIISSNDYERPTIRIPIEIIVEDTVTSISIPHSVPITFKLRQNYPNPFNPLTTIQYQLPQTNHVKLVVFNILGQKVRTLVDELQVAGNYQVRFDGSNLSSGIYYYRLETNGFSQQKKMLLLK